MDSKQHSLDSHAHQQQGGCPAAELGRNIDFRLQLDSDQLQVDPRLSGACGPHFSFWNSGCRNSGYTGCVVLPEDHWSANRQSQSRKHAQRLCLSHVYHHPFGQKNLHDQPQRPGIGTHTLLQWGHANKLSFRTFITGCYCRPDTVHERVLPSSILSITLLLY